MVLSTCLLKSIYLVVGPLRTLLQSQKIKLSYMLIYVDVLIFSKSYLTACLSRASRIRWPLISAAERSWTPAGLGFRLDFPGKSPWRTGIPVKREFFEISPTSEKQLSECVFVNALVLALKKNSYMGLQYHCIEYR